MKKLETIKPETVRQGILTSLSYSSPASKGHPPRKSCCETLNPLQVLGFPEVTGIHISVPIINVYRWTLGYSFSLRCPEIFGVLLQVFISLGRSSNGQHFFSWLINEWNEWKRRLTAGQVLVSTVNSCSTFQKNESWKSIEITWARLQRLLHNGIQEQIAASHEFDGVRKEKERLTAASLNKKSVGN